MNPTTMNGRPRRPQLADTIQKIDEMIDGLATAIPGAVADSVREVLAAVLPDAIQAAVAKATAEFAAALAALPAPHQPSPQTSPLRQRFPVRLRDCLARLRGGIIRAGNRLGRGVRSAWDSLLSRVRNAGATLSGLAVALSRVVRASPRTALAAALTGGGVAAVAYHLGPQCGAILAGLSAGVLTLGGVWLAPFVGLLTPRPDHA